MNKYLRFLFFITFGIILHTACQKDDPDDNDDNITIEDKTNNWIYKTLEENYLWEIPKKSEISLNEDAEDFFYSLLSNEDGKTRNEVHYYFSRIERKTSATKASSSNEPTYGFDYLAYAVQSGGVPTGEYYIRVLYVLPGSPAEEAGLKRGDWIAWIGEKNKGITDTNMVDSGNATTFFLIEYQKQKGNFTYSHSINISAARLVEDNPLLKDTVCLIDGKKIGYLLYNHFSSGPDNNSNEAYDNQMKEIFAQFKAQQVNEFVLDLRYNGGGLVSCARLLASFLVPVKDINKTFCILKYKKGDPKSVIFDRTVSASNLNIERLYVLIGSTTASASESVINGLIPYMDRKNIILIGSQTIGKTVGSNKFEDSRYDWSLHPITLRITNGAGEADYENGFIPDHELNYIPGTKEALNLYDPLRPLGDPDEALFAKAIELITGKTSTNTKAAVETSSNLVPVYYSMERKSWNKSLIAPAD